MDRQRKPLYNDDEGRENLRRTRRKPGPTKIDKRDIELQQSTTRYIASLSRTKCWRGRDRMIK